MKIRLADHVCLQPCATGYHVTVGRRSLLLDAANAQLIARAAGGASEGDLVRLVAQETGVPAEKLQSTMRSLSGMGVFVPADGAPPPRDGRFRTIPEAEIAAEPPALDAVLRFRRQTLLRPAPNGFSAWADALGGRVILGADAMRLLPSFAPPGQVVAKAVEAPSLDEGRRASNLAAVARLVKAGVLVPTRLGAAVAPAAPKLAPAPPPRKRPLRYSRDPNSARIPVYCVYSIHAEQLQYPPLALGLMIANAKQFRNGALLDRFDFVEDWLDSAEATEEAHRRHGPGVFLFSSYIWSERPMLEISKQIRARDPDSLIVIGGPSAPKYEQACADYFQAHPQLDVIVRGEGEVTLPEILDKVTSPLREVMADGRLASVAGLSFPREGAIVRTPERERAKDISQFPSPYLTGLFDNLTRDTEGGLKAVILETNRGCPYGCTFCDWGSATLQKIMKFPLERVEAELDWIGRNKITQIFCADANFGIFDRDVEIAQMLVRTREKHGFPTQLTVNYAKNATERHAEILRILTRGGIHSEAVLSIQSTSEQTLKTIRRQNIKTERYDQLADIFRGEQLSFASDLMIGLPGETVESFKDSLQYFFDRDVFIQAYQTVMLPNSPMADPEYVKENKIVTAGNILVGSYSYDINDLGMMIRLAGYYSLAVNLSVFKYVLHHLQHDRGLRAVDVIHAMVKKFEHGDGAKQYPLLSWILGRYRAELERALASLIMGDLDAPSSWEEFFAELRDFLVRELGVVNDSALETALAVQAAVLPREEGAYPLTVELKHDYARYLADLRAAFRGKGTARPLSEYPPGQLAVSDPGALSATPRPPQRVQDHISRFELESPLRPYTEGPRPVANVA